MHNLSALEHLKIARRLHFQGQNEEAIQEYQLVLEIDPENEDAVAGLRLLGAEPPDPPKRSRMDADTGVRTNFFVNQAKSAEAPAWRSGPLTVVIFLLAGLLVFGGYKFAMMMLNFDNIKATENVDAHITKMCTKEGGNTFVDVKVSNYNPGPVKDIVLACTLVDGRGNTLQEGKIPLKYMIPAGDSRTFTDIDLGTLKEKPDKIAQDTQKIESLIYGPKPKIPQRLAEKFIEVAQKPDTDTFADYDELTQDLDTFPPALIGMGRAYATKAGKVPANWDRAIEQYKKAIEFEPDNANAHYYLAIAYFYKKDMKAAQKEIEQAVQLVPDDPLYQWSQRYLFHTKVQLK